MLTEGCRRWFHRSREQYALSLAEETLYIITDPKDITAVHINSKTLGFNGYIWRLMAVMKVKLPTVEKFNHLPSKHDMSPAELKLNPGAKQFIGLTFDRYITQLSPRPRLDVLRSRFLEYLDRELHIDRLYMAASMRSSGTPKRANIFSLLRMCRNVIITCNSGLLFGARL